MVRQIILAGFVVFLPVGVQAQGHGMMPVSRSAAVAPRVAMAAPRVGSAQAMSGPGTAMRVGTMRPRTAPSAMRSTRRPTSARRRIDEDNVRLRPDCNSAPGLGFDAVHQSAICGSGTVGLRRRGLQVPFFFPFFDGGFSLPGSAAAVEQFVFVRRDGTLFFAVAYSWENGTLRYVTSQGLRHTVTQDALDLDATRQFNEQRGLNFRLPA